MVADPDPIGHHRIGADPDIVANLDALEGNALQGDRLLRIVRDVVKAGQHRAGSNADPGSHPDMTDHGRIQIERAMITRDELAMDPHPRSDNAAVAEHQAVGEDVRPGRQETGLADPQRQALCQFGNESFLLASLPCRRMMFEQPGMGIELRREMLSRL